MAESETVQDLLVKAESAAAAGDLASADELLHAIARMQERELGPQHPDLANTLNNLAIVAEKTERPGEAEKYYRRAVAIASASLPADDPMVVASRQNLEDFCRAQGVRIDRPDEADLPATTPAPTFTAPPPALAPPTPPVPQPKSIAAPPKSVALQAEASAARPSPSFAKVAIAIVALVATAMFVLRPWSTHETLSQDPSAAPAATSAQAAPPPTHEPARPLPAAVPAEPSQPPAAARPANDRNETAKPSAASGASGAVTLIAAQLCRTFSTSGAWRCVPAEDSVAPGPIVLYTRVKSLRDTVVVHRWYRGNRLRRSVQLEILANATDGYRTFSRQTVDRGEEWRVEVRSAAGDLLHEQRLTVR